MRHLILNTIKGKKWMWLIMSLMSLGLLWIYTALMPSLASQQEAINELLASFPKEFLAAFNVDSTSMNSFAAVIASKQFDIVWTIMVISLALSLASGNLASEVEKGTMQILLSLPLSRKQIYTAKYIGGLLLIVSFVIISILAGIPLAELYDVDYQAVNFWYFTLNGLGFGIFIYSLSFFTSALASESSKATFPVIGFMLVSYILNIIALLKEELSDLRYFSVFNYYSPSKTLIKGQPEWETLLMFLVLGAVLAVAGARIFMKRDIS